MYRTWCHANTLSAPTVAIFKAFSICEHINWECFWVFMQGFTVLCLISFEASPDEGWLRHVWDYKKYPGKFLQL